MSEKNVLAVLGSPHANGTAKVVYTDAKNKGKLPKRIIKRIERCPK